MKRSFIAMLLGLGMSVLQAADSVWLGTADGCWTNAANWSAGVPGKYYAPDGSVTGQAGDKATFGAVAAGAATTIDLDGVYSIYKVSVTGDKAPTYTFGTSAAQILPMEGGGKGTASSAAAGESTFHVESAVANMPVMAAVFGVSVDVTKDHFGHPTYSNNVTVCNDAAQTLHLNDYGCPKVAADAGTQSYRINFAGAGDIQLDGVWKRRDSANPGNYQFILSQTNAELIVNADCAGANGQGWLIWIFSSAENSAFTRKMKINAGKTVYLATGGNALNFNSPLTFYGDGELRFYSGGVWGGSIICGGYDGLRFQCRVTSTAATADVGAFCMNSSGIIYFEGDSDFVGIPRVTGDKGLFSVTSVGTKGVKSPLGTGTAVRLGGTGVGGGIRYTGAGETTDRDIHLGLWYDTYATLVANGRLVQAGTGPWYVDSVVTTLVADITHVLTLEGDVAAPGYVQSDLKDNPSPLALVKQGSGTWVFTGENTFSGGTTLKAGTLKLTAGGQLTSAVTYDAAAGATLEVDVGTDGAAATPFALYVKKGANTLMLNGSGTFEISAVTRTAGSLNVVCDQKQVRLKVTDQGAGEAASWLTINGETPEFNAAGELVKRTIAIDTAIAATGDTVPHDATKNVGILTAGTGGNDTLAAADTAVKALVQKASTPAVIAVGAAESLTAEIVAITEDAAALTIGTAAGQGTLVAGTGGEFAIENESTNALTVATAWRFPSASTSVTKGGAGPVRSLTPFALTGTLNIAAGAFVATDGTNLAASLTGAGTFVKEAPADWNFTKDQKNFSGDIVLAAGYNYLSYNDKFGDANGALVITNGATLDLMGGRLESPQNAITFGEKEVRLSGTGARGDGVIRFGYAEGVDGTLSRTRVDGTVGLRSDTYGNCFKYLTLVGDALIGITNCYSRLGVAGTSASFAVFDMNGHTLDYTGWGQFSFENCRVTNAGPITVHTPDGTVSGGDRAKVDLYAGADLGGDETTPLTFATKGYLMMQRPPPQRRALVIASPDPVSVSSIPTSSARGMATNVNHWLGPVTVNADCELSTYLSTSIREQSMAYSGPIGGAGDVAVAGCGYIYFFNPANTFAGTFSLNGSYGVRAFAAYPGTLPDYAKVSVSVGRLAVDGANWTPQKYYELVNAATLLNGGAIVVDPARAADAAVALAPGDAVGAGRALGCDGAGTVTLSGAIAAKPDLAVYNGTLKVTGADEKRFTGATVASDPSLGETATLLFENTTAELSGTTWVGRYANASAPSALHGAVVVRNAVVTCPLPADASGEMPSVVALGSGGGGSTSSFTVEEGGVVTNYFKLGAGYADGTGLLRLTGGSVCNYTVPNHGSLNIGEGNYACLAIEGGDYVQRGYVSRIGYLFPGCVFQTGGTFLHTLNDEKNWVPIVGARHYGAYYLKGGSCKSTPTFYLGESDAGAAGFNSRAVMTLDGAQAAAEFPAMCMANANNALAILNLNAGTFTVSRIEGHSARSGRQYLNFNGGTFRGSGAVPLYGAGDVRALTRVTVFAGGAVFDTSLLDQRIDASLCAPEGAGVTTVTVPGITEASYICPPAVEIVSTDGGYGATAIAEYDFTLGRVTNVKVTSAGCNYTAAGTKVVVWYGNTATTSGTVTVSANVGGGLTKKGANRLTLNAVNTYAGDTVIEGGELHLGVAGALPEGSTVVFKGGTLTAASGVDIPAFNLKLKIGETAAYPGAFAFPAGASVTVADLNTVDRAVGRYAVATFAGGVTGSPVLANATELPAGWQYAVRHDRINIYYPKGAALILR